MVKNIIDIYYFSGTGNTLLVVKKMREVFEKKGRTVHLFSLETCDPARIDTAHSIGLAFPVAEQGTYPFVWDFIRRMPAARDTDIFMVDTLLAFSGGIVGPVRKILRKKGYKTIGAKEILMPNNLFPTRINGEKNKSKVKKGLVAAEKYAVALLEGTAKWRRVPLLSDMMGMFSQSERSWRFLRGFYQMKVHSEICTQCGLCEKICPIGNISIDEYPLFNGRCTICMRCVSFCPQQAITRVKKKHLVYRAVKVSDIMDE